MLIFSEASDGQGGRFSVSRGFEPNVHTALCRDMLVQELKRLGAILCCQTPLERGTLLPHCRLVQYLAIQPKSVQHDDRLCLKEG